MLNIEPHLFGNLIRNAGIDENLSEVTARDFMGAELVVKDAEFELEAVRIGRGDEHQLEGGIASS